MDWIDIHWVYPRGCGGAAADRQLHDRPEGLSPRVRGSRRQGVGSLEGRGSIPAGAGEPDTHRASAPAMRVYPRGCGGAGVAMFEAEVISGLSPRVRGSHYPRPSRNPIRRSIPAGAGEPESMMS